MHSSLHLHIGFSMCVQHVNKCPGDLNWLVVTADYICSAPSLVTLIILVWKDVYEYAVELGL